MIKMIELENCKGYMLRGFLHLPENAKEIVVMLHGFTGNRTEHNGHYRTMSRKLEKLGIASLRLDYHGNGESDGEFRDFVFEDALDDGLRMIDYARHVKGIEKVYLLGFSMGGAIASIIANDKIVDNLILWSAAGEMVEHTEAHFNPNSCKILPNGNAYFSGFELSTAFRDSIKKYNMYQGTKNFTKKTLIVQGEKDLCVNPKLAERYHDEYVNSSLHFVPGAGHGYDTLEQMDDLYSTTIEFILNTRK